MEGVNVQVPEDLRPEVRAEVPEDLELEAQEKVPQVIRRRPEAPMRAEREAHELTHEPYRAWCPACVAGRARADAHRLRGEEEKGLPAVGVDYGYLWSRAAVEAGVEELELEEPPAGVKVSSPVLCGRNSRDGWVFGHLRLHDLRGALD